MLVEEIKRRMMAAMKSHNTVEKEILRTALGEISMGAVKAGTEQTDELSTSVVRKLLKSNEETLALATSEEQKQTLIQEMDVLRSLLPQSMSVDAIVSALAPVHDAMKAAKADGQATGVAMKHLKSTGAVVESKDVAEAVKRIRA